MLYLLYTIHVIVCLFLILVVLLQQGKGADLSVFGGGGTQTAFGPRGATTLLHKLTVWGFVAFTVLTIGIGFLSGRGRGGSVMEGVETEQSGPATPAPDPAAESEAGQPEAAEPGTGQPEAATPAAAEPGAAEPEAAAPEADPAPATEAGPSEPGDTPQ
ncbi:MAG: preprotein translocase subunit SecG [Thermoanaerobaculia bacterium]